MQNTERQGKSKPFFLKLEPALTKEIRLLAVNMDMSLTALATDALSEYLERHTAKEQSIEVV